MTLRPYQSLLIERTREAFNAGYTRPLVVLPCGAGKTVCFAYMAHAHVSRPNRYVWFLVHRRELIAQTLDTFKRMGISTTNIYVGMVGTALSHSTPPTLIIFDEAHHATARTWSRVTEAYPNVPVVGLTATPKRLNGDALSAVFDTIVTVIDADALMTHGYLSPYDYYAPQLPVNLSEIPMLGSDYNQSVVSDRFIESKIYGDIAKHVHLDRKTIIYAPTVVFSERLASEIPGVVHFDGNTPTTERDRIIQAFRDGDIRCLSNVDLIGEGFDVPDCDTVILARPTQSLVLYIQQSMRCMRPSEGKRAVVYDLVGNCYRHGMPTESREWTLEGRIVKPRGDVTRVRECGKCFRVYQGSNRICPYCEHDNGKTKAEIKQEQDAELARISEVKRTERKQAWTLEDLQRIERERGYKRGWAYRVYNSRRKRI